MAISTTKPGTEPAAHAPAIAAHRLLGNGCTGALLRADATVDWLCSPRFDSPPALWQLLDPSGGSAAWEDVVPHATSGLPAGPTARTVVRAIGGRVECWDGLLAENGVARLVRLVRAVDRPLGLVHRVRAGGFLDGHVDDHRTEVEVRPRQWSGVVLTFADTCHVERAQPGVIAALERAERERDARARRARLPALHPQRAADALAVIETCTYAPSGAVVAAVTTSLPEVRGGDRQFDYRYCWLRDASLALSVASRLGRADLAERYLEFVDHVAGGGVPPQPLFTVDGEAVPDERVVPTVSGWAGSTPVRTGNEAKEQVQYDALGFVVEAIAVHLQTGGRLDRETWRVVRSIAERLCPPAEHSSGIWELRHPADLVSADLGRWVGLDRAIWIARHRRPWARRRRWLTARAHAQDRVVSAIAADGSLPQAYGDDPSRVDAVALMIPIFGLPVPTDVRDRLIDTTLARLGEGPYVHRYDCRIVDDGFSPGEGAFLPVSWWAVAALACAGRVEEAEGRLDELCRQLPGLLAEEIDPASGELLGNTPLVWTHAELARALDLLEGARVGRRWGTLGLHAWRSVRSARLRLRARRTIRG